MVKVDSLAPHEFRDFSEGSPVQTEVMIPESDKSQYKKGSKIEVAFNDEVLKGKIVSDPLDVDPRRDDGKCEISIVIEKEG